MRIAVVAGVVVSHDAVSNAVVTQVAALHDDPKVDQVSVFTHAAARSIPCDVHAVGDAWELVTHPAFVACDLVIFHWAIRYDLFDAITLLDSDELPTPVVHFHNCTPAALVLEAERPAIIRSMRQIAHAIHLGLPLWTFSEFNRRTLLEWGAREDQIRFVPFPVALTDSVQRADRRSDTVELLVVGRMVPAKGIHVFVEALALLPKGVLGRIAVRVVSSATFSDVSYRRQIEDRIGALHLSEVINLVDDPTDEELAAIYATTDLVVSPSFHEGLCVPVIEAYAYGCRAIGTAAGNLPYIVIPPDPVVAPGDPVALANAIVHVIRHPVSDDGAYDRRRRETVEQFSYGTAHDLLIDACRATVHA